ncbi:hypothetical protein GCM10011584_29260 [Nocardioides phosphati]|uniref:DNA-binding protein n=1 Tax=Nocardioides phosphati TaxID=1867775 RepID=A0ABQ2NE87_9ACTN|nr:hypothetical protein [Nocardioides phosphati]GGO92572.1 hypothetical protein GCM10011584_29260 [Nocardioides phosphati]
MISFTIESASKATHIGQDRIREAIQQHNLIAHYVGTKAIILAGDLAEWIETLPTERAS